MANLKVLVSVGTVLWRPGIRSGIKIALCKLPWMTERQNLLIVLQEDWLTGLFSRLMEDDDLLRT